MTSALLFPRFQVFLQPSVKFISCRLGCKFQVPSTSFCQGLRQLSCRTVKRTSTLHRTGFRLFLDPNATHHIGKSGRVQLLFSRGKGHSSWQKSANRNTVMYAIAIAITVTGLSYAAVPLYRIFCQASGYGGTVVKVDAGEKVEKMEAIRERELTIRFNADTSAALLWKFRPHQREIKIVPGETALAFYTAENPTDKAVTGIATYNVIPFEAGLYFNKIQCFCFEEQRLNPHEQVDMPVFFYIDPEFDDDPHMAKVDTITLSYTFFESKESDQMPQPLTVPA